MDETGQPGAPTPGEHGNGAGPQGDPARPANGWATDAGWSGAETGVDPNGRQWQPAVEPAVSRGWGDRAAYTPRPLPASPGFPVRELRQPVNGVHLGEAPEPERGWNGGPGFPYEAEVVDPAGRQGPGPEFPTGAVPEFPSAPDYPGQPGQFAAPGEPDLAGTARHAFGDPASFGDPGYPEPERGGVGPAGHPPRWGEPAMPVHPGPTSAPPAAVSGPPSAGPVPPVVASGPPATVSGPPAMTSGLPAAISGPPVVTSGAPFGPPGQPGGAGMPEQLLPTDFDRGHGLADFDRGHGPVDSARGHGPVDSARAHGLADAAHGHGTADAAQGHGPADAAHGHGTADAAHGHGPADAAHGYGAADSARGRGYRSASEDHPPVTEMTALMPAVPRQPDRSAQPDRSPTPPPGPEQAAPAGPGWRPVADERGPAPAQPGDARGQEAPSWSSGWAPPWAPAGGPPEQEGVRYPESQHVAETVAQAEPAREPEPSGGREQHWSPGWAEQPAQRVPEAPPQPVFRDGHPLASPTAGFGPNPAADRNVPTGPEDALRANDPTGYSGPVAPGPEAPGYLPGPGGLAGPPGPEPRGYLAGPAGLAPPAPEPGPAPGAESAAQPAPGPVPGAESAGYPSGPPGPPPAAEPAGQQPVGPAPGYPYRREALALPTGPSYPGAPYRYPESAPAEPAPAARPAEHGDVLPQRVPAEPDVPTVPEPPNVEPPAETPELARIATHLRREDGAAQLRERPDGFDVNAILDAVRGVAGVRDASLRTTPAGAHSLRLDLADGADPAEVSRHVARLLQERMGLAAAPQNLPGAPAPTPPGFVGTAAPSRPAPAQPRHAPPAGPERAEPATEEPRRRHQGPGHRGRATVGEPATAPPGEAGRSAAPPGAGQSTVGSSYSGSPVTTTETAPSRPLNPGSPPGPRVIIDHVQVSTFGLDATVEVRLAAGKQPAAGLATGPAVDGYVLRLCAVAAAAAIDELLSASTRVTERGRCFVEHAAVVPFGSCEVATVVVLLVCDGWVEQLAGSALVSGDPRQAVVRATLAAVNRRLEALLT